MTDFDYLGSTATASGGRREGGDDNAAIGVERARIGGHRLGRVLVLSQGFSRIASAPLPTIHSSSAWFVVGPVLLNLHALSGHAPRGDLHSSSSPLREEDLDLVASAPLNASLALLSAHTVQKTGTRKDESNEVFCRTNHPSVRFRLLLSHAERREMGLKPEASVISAPVAAKSRGSRRT